MPEIISVAQSASLLIAKALVSMAYQALKMVHHLICVRMDLQSAVLLIPNKLASSRSLDLQSASLSPHLFVRASTAASEIAALSADSGGAPPTCVREREREVRARVEH